MSQRCSLRDCCVIYWGGASSVLLFGAVAFAQLYDWGVAMLDERVVKKTPVKQVQEHGYQLADLKRSRSVDRLLGDSRSCA